MIIVSVMVVMVAMMIVPVVPALPPTTFFPVAQAKRPSVMFARCARRSARERR